LKKNCLKRIKLIKIYKLGQSRGKRNARCNCEIVIDIFKYIVPEILRFVWVVFTDIPVRAFSQLQLNSALALKPIFSQGFDANHQLFWFKRCNHFFEVPDKFLVLLITNENDGSKNLVKLIRLWLKS
jgi:hypothetical protein